MGEWNAMTVTETELIPVLDVGRYLAGDHRAGEGLARQLQLALEQIGFFFVVNHGLDWQLVDETYRQAARLHALPDAVKEGLVMGPDSRYAIPFFYGPRNDALIEALPTCVGSDNPPRYEPITNGDYQRWFRNRNYASYTGEEAGPEAP
jgi:isopenicillin N synthase-like dioxygenase